MDGSREKHLANNGNDVSHSGSRSPKPTWKKLKVLKPLSLLHARAHRKRMNDSLEEEEEEEEEESWLDGPECRRLTFNVGGVVFQTVEKSFDLIKAADTFKLASPAFLKRHYDSTRGEYFFDRDPEVFRSVLNYWRTGHLHLPANMCGPQVKEELDFWGLKEQDIRPCCWYNFNDWMETMASLERLQKDRQPQHQGYAHPDHQPTGIIHRLGLFIWRLLTEPSSSLSAKIYAYISLLFVIMAIFSFCASTHEAFHLKSGSANNSTNATSTIFYSTNGTTQLSTGKRTDLSRSASNSFREHELIPALFYIDIMCLVFFTTEYLLRLICAPVRWRFVISFIAVIDVLAILPDYVEIIFYWAIPGDREKHMLVDLLPFLRLMRAFRIFRLIRRVPGLWIMMYTLRASFKELSLMLIILLVGMLFFSSVIFFIDDPEVFVSIPHGFWWAIVTMTTVGYGDMTPVTAWGKIVGSVTAICGVLIIGFTIPALVNNFITYYRHVEFVVRQEKLQAEDTRQETGVVRALEQDVEQIEKENGRKYCDTLGEEGVPFARQFSDTGSAPPTADVVDKKT